MGYEKTYQNRKPTFKSDVMKLTTEQIQQIELKLYNDYEFYYDDAKHEIIDHIASEIENRKENESFETAFERIFTQWDSRLKDTEWNGIHFYGKIKIPAFYKQKMQKSLRTDLMYYVLAVLFFPVAIYLLKDFITLETLNRTVFVYKILLVTTAVFGNQYVLRKYETDKYTTVYGEIAQFANKRNLGPLLLLSFVTLSSQELRYWTTFNIWLLSLTFINAFYFLFIIKYCNYFRHLSMVKKIRKWNVA